MAGNMHDRCQCFANVSLTDTACIGENNDACIFFDQCKQAKAISLKLFGKKNDAGEAFDYGELNEAQRQQIEDMLKGGEKPGRARPTASVPKAESRPVKDPEADMGSPMDDLERELEASLSQPSVVEPTPAAEPTEAATVKPKRGRKPKAVAEQPAEESVPAVQETLPLTFEQTKVSVKETMPSVISTTVSSDQEVIASAILALAAAIEKLAACNSVPVAKSTPTVATRQPVKKGKPAAGKRGRPKKK